MIIWSGFGALTALIALAGLVLGVAVQPAIDQTGAGLPPGTGLALGLLLAAAANWFVGTRLNNRPGRELVDPRTGQRVVIRRRHTLFWIPMQYWSALLLVAAVGMLFATPPDGETTRAGLAAPHRA